MTIEAPSHAQAMMRLVMSYIPTRVIYVAAKFGLADHIERDGAMADDLAAKLAVDPSALYRVLRTLAGLGVLHQGEDNRFFVTPLGETLRKDSPQSVCDYTIYSHEFVYEAFRGISECVRTGKPVFDDLFEHLRVNPEQQAIFHAAMSNRARIEARAILDAYVFPQPQIVVDVGGGNGGFLSAILLSYAGVSAILLEQESAIEAARAGRGGPLPRCELVAGNFFDAVPGGGDTYILKRVLLDWTEDEAARILSNCRRAMAHGARLLIIEPLIGAPNQPSAADLFDMTFLVMLHGKVRSEDYYRRLLANTGFTVPKTIPTATEVFVIEAAAA